MIRIAGTSVGFHSGDTPRRLARSHKAILVIAAVFILLLFSPFRSLKVARGESAARDMIAEAFSAVVEAEKAGGDVTPLVASLNEALSLVEQGERSADQAEAAVLYERATQIADQVLASAPMVKEAGLVAQRSSTTFLVVSMVALGVTGLVAYLFVPPLFWMLWLRGHRGWRVEPR
jgi:hypothetical protein